MVSKKGGLISIIVGILIPSVLYPFTQLSGSVVLVQTVMPQNGVNSLYRWRDLEVVFMESGWHKLLNENNAQYDGRIAVPYHFIVAFGITLFFVGIALIVFAKNKNERDRNKPIRLIAEVDKRKDHGGDHTTEQGKAKASEPPPTHP